MTKPMIRIHNISIDEVIDREMTDAEFNAYKADQELQANREAEAEAKEMARQQVLTKLGLTAEEAKALLG